jgi:hypothetical protein
MYNLTAEGDATHQNNLKSIRFQVVEMRKVVDDLAKDVKTLKEAP